MTYTTTPCLLLRKSVFSETGDKDWVEWFFTARDRDTQRSGKLGQFHCVCN